MTTSDHGPVELSVVVINWNAGDVLRGCLHSLEAATSDVASEVIVVDNASGDDSLAMVASRFPAVRVVVSPTNVGFGAGCNLGLAAAAGESVAFLNPDTEVPGGAFRRLVDVLRARPGAALVVPRIIMPDGREQTKTDALPPLARAIPGLAVVIRGIRRQGASSATGPRRVSRFHGSALVVRREALLAIGGMPTVTFMYGEEVLLAHRLAAHGYTMWLDQGTTVVHHDDVSANRRWQPDEKIRVKTAARIAVMREVMGPVSYRLWATLSAANLMVRAIAGGLTHSGKDRQLRELASLYVGAVRSGGAGPPGVPQQTTAKGSKGDRS